MIKEINKFDKRRATLKKKRARHVIITGKETVGKIRSYNDGDKHKKRGDQVKAESNYYKLATVIIENEDILEKRWQKQSER